jgi:hypothetical protein
MDVNAMSECPVGTKDTVTDHLAQSGLDRGTLEASSLISLIVVHSNFLRQVHVGVCTWNKVR